MKRNASLLRMLENGKDKMYMTVVFEYSQGASLPNALSSAFKSESGLFHDTRITAISLEDEIKRVEQLENESY